MDLAMLLPYCIGLMAVTGFHPARLLFPLGVALIAASVLFKNQITIQPMKLVASLAIGTAAVQHGIHPETISTAALLTGLIWLLITAFGLSKTISTWLPRETVTGLNIAIGLSLMLTGLQLMWDTPYWSAMLFLMTSVLLKRQPFLTLLLVTVADLALNLLDNAGSLFALNELKMNPVLPTLRLPLTDGLSLYIALTVLVLPQLILTADHQVWSNKKTHGKLGWSIGALNSLAGLLGSTPLGIHADGQLNEQPGRTSSNHVTLTVGFTLIIMASLFSESIMALVDKLPDSALGVMIFFAGLQLIMNNMQAADQKKNMPFVLVTVLVFSWHPGLAVLMGLVYRIASRKRLQVNI